MGVIRAERYDKKIEKFKASVSHAEKVSVQFARPPVVYAILLSLSLQWGTLSYLHISSKTQENKFL